MTRAERESARLLDMIREAGAPVPDGAGFLRLYTSPAQRSAGAWAWCLVDAAGLPVSPGVGSQWPRRILLARGVEASRDSLRHTLADWHIDPAS